MLVNQECSSLVAFTCLKLKLEWRILSYSFEWTSQYSFDLYPLFWFWQKCWLSLCGEESESMKLFLVQTFDHQWTDKNCMWWLFEPCSWFELTFFSKFPQLNHDFYCSRLTCKKWRTKIGIWCHLFSLVDQDHHHWIHSPFRNT